MACKPSCVQERQHWGLKSFMMPSGEYDDDEGDDDDDVFMHIMSFRRLAKKHVFNVNYIYPFFLGKA